ncbi:MAG: hypothetical protein U0003_02280 [Vampirovibrionales bacterium]
MLQTAKDRLAVATLWGDSLERRNVTDQLKKLDKTPPDSLEYNPAMDAYVLRTRYEDVFQLNTSSSAKK